MYCIWHRLEPAGLLLFSLPKNQNKNARSVKLPPVGPNTSAAATTSFAKYLILAIIYF